MFDSVPGVVAVSMLNERISHRIGFAIRDEFVVVVRLDADDLPEFLPHRVQAEFDVMVASKEGEAMASAKKRTERFEEWEVTIGDCLEFGASGFLAISERRPISREAAFLRFRFLPFLREKINHVSVDHQFYFCATPIESAMMSRDWSEKLMP